MILAEIQDALICDRAFASSPDALAKLAATAMPEYQAGKTQKLDISIAFIKKIRGRCWEESPIRLEVL